MTTMISFRSYTAIGKHRVRLPSSIWQSF